MPIGGAESRVWRCTDGNNESKFVVAGHCFKAKSALEAASGASVGAHLLHSG
jgi:hypothetical protein